ncbi:hypothetical protein ACFXQA_03580 [Microbacterium sp. P07]|uniref:hypothetical protein n=1 Tax=Microbacterium sp. P07 TaxID=3366952 RepID=UPI0037463ACF
MSYIPDNTSTRGGSPIWASALGAAMGDGIVPRTASATHTRPRFFGRATSSAETAASTSDGV